MESISKSDPAKEPWVPVQPGIFRYPLAEGETAVLLANRCRRCEEVFFPKRRLCHVCFSTDMEELRLEGRGVIYSSTVVYVSSPAGIKAPYAYGYVDMASGGIRLFALFSGERPDAFLSGREVELELGAVAVNSRGQQIIGYQFRLVSEKSELQPD